MKNFQKKSLAIVSVIAMNTYLSAGAVPVQLEISAGSANFGCELSGPIQKLGGGSLGFTASTNNIQSLDLRAGSVMVGGTANLGASTAVSISGSGAQLQGAGPLAVSSLALSAPGKVTNSAATTLASVSLGGNALTTNSTGGTTITSLIPDATGSILNADAIRLVGTAAVAQPVNIGGTGTVTIAGPLSSTGGSVLKKVILDVAGQLPTGNNAISDSLSLAQSGAAAAIRSATNFSAAAQLNIPATVTPGSIAGAVMLTCGAVVKPAGSVDASILGAGGSFNLCPGAKILVVDGADWSAPLTFAPASAAPSVAPAATSVSAAPSVAPAATPVSAAPRVAPADRSGGR